MQAACGRSSIIPSLRGGMLICLREANPAAGHKGTIHYYLLRSNLGKDLGATRAKGNGLCHGSGSEAQSSGCARGSTCAI